MTAAAAALHLKRTLNRKYPYTHWHWHTRTQKTFRLQLDAGIWLARKIHIHTSISTKNNNNNNSLYSPVRCVRTLTIFFCVLSIVLPYFILISLANAVAHFSPSFECPLSYIVLMQCMITRLCTLFNVYILLQFSNL